MSNLNLSIGGRNFTVACAPGEEDHVTTLGRMIDEKLTAMNGGGGQSEARMLLFAALLLADEVHEARSNPIEAARGGGASDAVAERLEALAGRMENLAARLEG